ncbi:MAG: thioredoxin family protein [Bacillota bacterium]|nr:thioredoxin family protein [Bacillota bacterium]MDI3316982.1 thioredoxin family protein [Bacillota bacterium]
MSKTAGREAEKATGILEVPQEEVEALLRRPPEVMALLFVTPTCGQCGLLERALEAVLPALPPFPVYRLWVEESRRLVERFAVSSAPTLKLLIRGEPVHTWFGARTPDDLYYMIRAYLPESLLRAAWEGAAPADPPA